MSDVDDLIEHARNLADPYRYKRLRAKDKRMFAKLAGVLESEHGRAGKAEAKLAGCVCADVQDYAAENARLRDVIEQVTAWHDRCDGPVGVERLQLLGSILDAVPIEPQTPDHENGGV